MKNVVIFEKDTDREVHVQLKKTKSDELTMSQTDGKAMIVEDISTATEGLMNLVRIADGSGYMDANKSAELIVKYFTDVFLTKKEN